MELVRIDLAICVIRIYDDNDAVNLESAADK